MTYFQPNTEIRTSVEVEAATIEPPQENEDHQNAADNPVVFIGEIEDSPVALSRRQSVDGESSGTNTPFSILTTLPMLLILLWRKFMGLTALGSRYQEVLDNRTPLTFFILKLLISFMFFSIPSQDIWIDLFQKIKLSERPIQAPERAQLFISYPTKSHVCMTGCMAYTPCYTNTCKFVNFQLIFFLVCITP